jgi:putative oxidoreductase
MTDAPAAVIATGVDGPSDFFETAGATRRTRCMTLIGTVTRRGLAVAEKLSFVPSLLARITLGVLFASTGWGKVHNLAKVTDFFVELKIPMPSLNAVVVSYSELVCGSLLVIGLASRLATFPLIASMVVALLTAKASEIHGFADLFGEVEFTYLVLLIVVAIGGPGPVSLDRPLSKWLAKRGLVAPAPTPATAH